jgi:transcription elongation factor GreA
VDAIEESATKNQRLNPALTFELVVARDDLLTRVPQLKTTKPDLTLTRLIREEESRLATILPNLSSAKERRVLHTLPAALESRWIERALRLMQERHARMVSQIPKVFVEAGQEAELRSALERSIREHSATSEALFWLCKERNDTWQNLISPDLLAAILGSLERDQHNETARGTRLRDLLLDDRELIPEMFRDAEMDVARDAMRRLMLTPVFDDLTKRSLLARIIKLYPELEAMVTGAQPEEKSEALVVSWSSLHKRKEEYEELVKKKIPENTREISLARSYGDLSENFEYKAAKQMQAVLMRRKTELEQMLHRARGTAFQSPDTTRVSIGTVVTLRDTDSNAEETYSILGAWDGDPERNIISYQAAMGQALLGHSLGEVVTLNTDHGSGRFAIISIEAAPVDEAPVDPALVEIPVEEVAAS